MKTKGRRVSSNLVDNRDKNFIGKKGSLGDAQLRQIFQPGMSKSLTKLSNQVANADRLKNKGKGATASKAPVAKAPKPSPKVANMMQGKMYSESRSKKDRLK